MYDFEAWHDMKHPSSPLKNPSATLALHRLHNFIRRPKPTVSGHVFSPEKTARRRVECQKKILVFHFKTFKPTRLPLVVGTGHLLFTKQGRGLVHQSCCRERFLF